MKNLYESAFQRVGTPAQATATHNLQASPNILQAIEDGLNRVVAEGVSRAAQAWQASQPIVQEEDKDKAKSKWSELVKFQIIRCHGLPDDTTWDSVQISSIWEEYHSESKRGAAGFQDVFQTHFCTTPSISDGNLVTPHLSRASANDIKAGRFCPAEGQLTYDNCDQGLMPLAFTEKTAEQKVQEPMEDDEYTRVTHRTIKSERARGNRDKEKKAP